MTDYRKYRLGIKEWMNCFFKALLLSGLLAWLFYKSLWAMCLLTALFPFLLLSKKKEGVKKRQQELSFQFKECVRIVADALQAGYSTENAFLEAERELGGLLGKQAIMCLELHEMNQQVRLNQPLEKQLMDLSLRSGVEEILSFTQVFGYAKRSGGDFIKILKATAERISDKVETTREIEIMISGKQLEQRIMNVIPLGILLFVNIGSPGLMELMYDGLFGRMIMSACLVLYIAAFLLSRKIVDIRI